MHAHRPVVYGAVQISLTNTCLIGYVEQRKNELEMWLQIRNHLIMSFQLFCSECPMRRGR